MTPAKRAFDIFISASALVLLSPLLLIITLALMLREGRPVFYLSERMRSHDEGFTLIKFRTMSPQEGDSGVSGGNKTSRITSTGAFLRRWRLDELPQLWNVLRGDISMVGPRPPLRQYVEAFPHIYVEVLACRPGLTGLATIEFHAREAALLARCRDGEECDRVYSRRCVPAKARLDLIYRQRRSVWLDLLILLRTFSPRIPLKRRKPFHHSQKHNGH